MLIFKVMVCFLVVFTSEDYVGGLPRVQDSPDNHEAVQSARSASNQGVTNEPGIRSSEVLDYAEEDEQEVGDVGASTTEIIKMFHQMLKFEPEAVAENKKEEKVLGDNFRKGFSSTDQFLDKSKSRNDETNATTSNEFYTSASSPGAGEIPRYSNVNGEEVDVDDKVEKNKEEFKNHLSNYLADVLQTIARENASMTVQNSTEMLKNDENSNATDEVFSKTENGGNLLSGKTKIPIPEEESTGTELENRKRKSLGDVVIWHQQSTNMRPTRTQHLVQNKRSTGEGSLKLPGYGGRRNSNGKNSKSIERRGGPGLNRRHFTADGSPHPRINQLQFSGVNPLQINAAAAKAYSNRQSPSTPQALNVDLSRALYQFGPAQVNALRGVFDNVPPPTKNFKPIAPKQVAYVPPRIVYETKIVPTPFMPFRTEQKTVDALSALLGQSPTQQLEGFNLIIGKNRPEEGGVESTSPSYSSPEISRQGNFHESVTLSQSFVTPIPSIDIHSVSEDAGSFRFSQGEEVDGPFDLKTNQYSIQENIRPQDNTFRTIPIVEEPEEPQRGHQANINKEVLQVEWHEDNSQEKTRDQNEGRYFNHNHQGADHDDAYAAKYSFGYHVKDYESGNDFGHQETRDGVVTNGRYHVLLPDGRLQNVKYHVDEGGYHAKVSYQLNPSA